MAQFNGALNIACPSCGELLPQVRITSPVGRFDGTGRGWTLKLEANLDSDWWAEVNATHISCVLL